jgi:hypothetical protein
MGRSKTWAACDAEPQKRPHFQTLAQVTSKLGRSTASGTARYLTTSYSSPSICVSFPLVQVSTCVCTRRLNHNRCIASSFNSKHLAAFSQTTTLSKVSWLRRIAAPHSCIVVPSKFHRVRRSGSLTRTPIVSLNTTIPPLWLRERYAFLDSSP